jgi:hypothetical protein
VESYRGLVNEECKPCTIPTTFLTHLKNHCTRLILDTGKHTYNSKLNFNIEASRKKSTFQNKNIPLQN